MSPTPETISDLVRLFVRTHYKTQVEAARDLNLSQQYLGAVCRGLRPPSEPILNAMGLKRVVIYVPKDGAP